MLQREKVKVIIEIIEIPSVMEVLPTVLEIEKETLYWQQCLTPGLLDSFIDDFILLISELSTEHRMLIVGNFNLDQVLRKNIAKVDTQI